MRTIINIPHPTLRKQALPIIELDKRILNLVKELQNTLLKKTNPRGVGLAAPQIDVSLRMFCTLIQARSKPKIYCNPTITNHSSKLTLGPDPKEPIMEGCLSMPGLYGPVPRFEWIEAEYQYIDEENKFNTESKRFTDYEARVFQHELDHLDGILFTDHSIQYDLPVYVEKEDAFIEVDKSMFSF